MVPDPVLVSGATGFVGSHVARAFAGAGYEVRCGVRATSDTRPIEDLGAKMVPLDLGRPAELEKAVEDIQTVVHVAGITRARRAEDYYRVNAEGTRRLAGAAARARVRKFVLISSLAARGPDALAKDGQDHPASAYGRSKLEAEEHLRSLSGRMETVILRPSAVYGPRDTDLLPLFGAARRGWLPVPPGPNLLQPVYAADVARAALRAAGCGAADPGPFPVAEAARYAWRDVAGGLEKALGRPVRAVRLPVAAFGLAGAVAEGAAKLRGRPPLFDGRRARDVAIHAWTCDVAGTEQALGWRAEVPLFEGLRRTVEWYRREGWM